MVNYVGEFYLDDVAETIYLLCDRRSYAGWPEYYAMPVADREALPVWLSITNTKGFNNAYDNLREQFVDAMIDNGVDMVTAAKMVHMLARQKRTDTAAPLHLLLSDLRGDNGELPTDETIGAVIQVLEPIVTGKREAHPAVKHLAGYVVRQYRREIDRRMELTIAQDDDEIPFDHHAWNVVFDDYKDEMIASRRHELGL